MSNISQIGPKLETSDHHTEEKDFLEGKKAADDIILGENEEKKDMKLALDAVQNNGFELMSPASKLSASIAESKNFDDHKSPISSCKKKENKKGKMINLMNILMKVKNLALKVKDNFYYKNYKNMTDFQKKILNDASVLVDGQNLKKNLK